MTNKTEFWKYFNQFASPKLAHRERTFRKIFEFLDSVDGPVSIVETGCARIPDNWSGDGQSTILFDKYISLRDRESSCLTVDISPESVNNCKKLVSTRVQVIQDDSVHFLHQVAKDFSRKNAHPSFVYLDSFDLEWAYWQPSAIHHLKELAALNQCLNEKTLVVVDDCPLNADLIPTDDGQIHFFNLPIVGGKARLVAEYAQAVGAKLEFAEYQAGWTGF